MNTKRDITQFIDWLVESQLVDKETLMYNHMEVYLHKRKGGVTKSKSETELKKIQDVEYVYNASNQKSDFRRGWRSCYNWILKQ